MKLNVCNLNQTVLTRGYLADRKSSWLYWHMIEARMIQITQPQLHQVLSLWPHASFSMSILKAARERVSSKFYIKRSVGSERERCGPVPALPAQNPQMWAKPEVSQALVTAFQRWGIAQSWWHPVPVSRTDIAALIPRTAHRCCWLNICLTNALCPCTYNRLKWIFWSIVWSCHKTHCMHWIGGYLYR